MEYKELPAIILSLVLVGMLITVGILVFDYMATSSRETSGATTAEVQLVYNTNASLGAVDIDTVSAIVFANASSLLAKTNNYTISYTEGYIQLRESAINHNYTNVTYTFLEKGRAYQALNNMSVTTETIPSTWLPLIITIAVLAIILGLVIASFGKQRE